LDSYNLCKIFFCLGTCEITAEDMLIQIRKHDTSYEWSYYTGNYRLSFMCERFIEASKENRKKCEQLDCVKFYDTANDREEVFRKIIEDTRERIK